MTIGRAFQFITAGQSDSALRRQLNQAESVSQLYDILKHAQLSFSPFDFDEAFKYRLLKCQVREEADRLEEFKAWWETLHRVLAPDACDPLTDCDSAALCMSRGKCDRGCS